MHGNVWEWVEDDWHDTYDRAPTDGSAWTDGSDWGKFSNRGAKRVIRGGSYLSNAGNCKSECRLGHDPDSRENFIGFRLVIGESRWDWKKLKKEFAKQSG